MEVIVDGVLEVNMGTSVEVNRGAKVDCWLAHDIRVHRWWCFVHDSAFIDVYGAMAMFGDPM